MLSSADIRNIQRLKGVLRKSETARIFKVSVADVESLWRPPAKPRKLSYFDGILKALARKAGGYGIEARFPWGELVVLAHEDNPGMFAMRGYDCFPCTRTICSACSKMLKDGLLVKSGAGRGSRKQAVWNLTVEGLRRGIALLKNAS